MVSKVFEKLVNNRIIISQQLRLFSVIDSFDRFRMGSLHKSIQLMLELLKGLLLALHFPYYILRTFLMMLSVLLPSMLMMILLRHLICGNNLNGLLNLNLIYETLWAGARSGLLISILGKLIWFHLTDLITLDLLM